MFRLTAVLCAGLYLGLLVGGEDRGQLRFGLMQADPTWSSATPAPVPAPVPARVESIAAAQPEPEAVAVTRRALPEGVAQLPLVVAASFSETPDTSQTFSLANPAAEAAGMAFAATEMVLDPQAAARVTQSDGSPDSSPDAAAAATSVNVVRVVVGSSVNVREGPSTEAVVLGKLLRGEEVLVIRSEANGWARVRIEGDGIEGYVATRFLSEN